jgi:hypothetical protein
MALTNSSLHRQSLTPLQLAGRKGHVGIVSILLGMKANHEGLASDIHQGLVNEQVAALYKSKVNLRMYRLSYTECVEC